eukprot:5380_1
MSDKTQQCYYNTDDNIAEYESKDINPSQLLPYLLKTLPNEFDVNPKKKLLIYDLIAGFSSSPYVLQYDNRRYLLRKCPDKPVINIDDNAQTQEQNLRKQYDICKLLSDKYDFPVPKMYLFCDDKTIIGQQFYIMQFIEGRVIFNERSTLPRLTKKDRTEIYYEIMRVMAKLHNIDMNKYGLKHIIESSKQIKWTSVNILNRWKNSFIAANKDNNISNDLKNKIETFYDAMMNYYTQKMRTRIEDEALCIVHGDIHFENIIFHPTENKIIALVDWEVCMIGNPLIDLAYFTKRWNMRYIESKMNFPYAALPDKISGGLLDLKTLKNIGIPTQMEMVQKYVSNRKRVLMNNINNHWNFYNALMMYRFVAIFYEIYKQNPNSELGQQFNPLILLEFWSVIGSDVVCRNVVGVYHSKL